MSVLVQAAQHFCAAIDALRFSTAISIFTSWLEPLVHVYRPALRTSHQTVLLKQYLYVFGGELTSLNQVCKSIQHLFSHLSLCTQVHLAHSTAL